MIQFASDWDENGEGTGVKPHRRLMGEQVATLAVSTAWGALTGVSFWIGW